jgi:hypothetical protein
VNKPVFSDAITFISWSFHSTYLHHNEITMVQLNIPCFISFKLKYIWLCNGVIFLLAFQGFAHQQTNFLFVKYFGVFELLPSFSTHLFILSFCITYNKQVEKLSVQFLYLFCYQFLKEIESMLLRNIQFICIVCRSVHLLCSIIWVAVCYVLIIQQINSSVKELSKSLLCILSN